MSDLSERRLQRTLDRQGYYTVRTPGSGTGLKQTSDGEDGDDAGHKPHPDVIAISGARSDLLIVEDKHTDDYPVYLDQDQYHGLVTVAQKTGGYPVVAVQVKHTEYPHDYHPLPLGTTKGGNAAIRDGGVQADAIPLETLVKPDDRPEATLPDL